jgi:3'-5' exoribonuclease
VQAIGEITLYQGKKRQISLSGPLRVLPRDGRPLEQFLPSLPAREITKAWDWVDKQVSAIKSLPLRRAAELFFRDDAFRVLFERAPASTGGHHAVIGGLLQHVVEVAHIAKQTALVMKANADLALVGALLHDIGKVEAYEVSAGGFSPTVAGHLAGHVVLGTWMLQRRLDESPTHGLSAQQILELQHFILSHHGVLEFGAAVQPLTAEAEIVHWADEASAKANDMQESIADEEFFTDGADFAVRRPWRVGRRVWRRPFEW